MTQSITKEHDRTALNARFARHVAATETPESIGRFLYRWILTDGVGKGELSADGKSITIPISITVEVPPLASAATHKSKITGSSKFCISSFGYDLVCIKYVIESETTE